MRVALMSSVRFTRYQSCASGWSVLSGHLRLHISVGRHFEPRPSSKYLSEPHKNSVLELSMLYLYMGVGPLDPFSCCLLWPPLNLYAQW